LRCEGRQGLSLEAPEGTSEASPAAAALAGVGRGFRGSAAGRPRTSTTGASWRLPVRRGLARAWSLSVAGDPWQGGGMADTQKLSGDQITELGLADWRPMLGRMRARFRTGDFVTGLRLVTEITSAAEALNHHPDLDLRYPHVNVTLSSHDVRGLTQRDVDLARRISEIAAELGVPGEPVAVQTLEIGLDTWDADEIRPFWTEVLGLTEEHGDLYDRAGDLPALWFQETDRHEEPRQRFHLDVTVPQDVAEQRIAAALAAGGVLVSDSEAPRFTVLADAQGNKVCVCTSVGRSA
jgi:4a-hydroxytetrahydrobiopterin dehydratase